MSQLKSFLKVEAVNIYKSILDTTQLSVIRGSSFLLKQAIENLNKHIEPHCNSQLGETIVPISVGGSNGIFEVANLSLERAEELVWNVLSKQTEGIALTDMFCFTVNTTKANNYLFAKEILFAKGRHDQATQFSSAMLLPTGSERGACALNGVLPADIETPVIKAAKGHAISQSTKRRYLTGRNVKTSLYATNSTHLACQSPNKDVIEDASENPIENKGYAFPTDLEALAGRHQVESLNGKVAVIYADGNNFGRKQRRFIRDSTDQIAAQQQFDVQLKSKRAEYLLSLVSFIRSQKAIQIDDKGKAFIPLETLLWGGDEMTIVVPAWLGFRVLDHFMSGYGTFEIEGQELTHAIGIVFCSHKTPIQKAQKAAIDLADHIKSVEGGRDKTYFDYMVLESIDYPTQMLDEFWGSQYGKIAKFRTALALKIPFSLGGNTNPESCKCIQRALEHLPRSSVYNLVELAIATQTAIIPEPKASTQNEKSNRKGTAGQLADYLDKIRHPIGDNCQQDIALLTSLFSLLAVNDSAHKKNEEPTIATSISAPMPTEYTDLHVMFWLHLLELYDYLAPEPPTKSDITQGATQ